MQPPNISIQPSPTTSPITNIGMHDSPAVIQRNHFQFKSLSSWSLNLFMGCCHGCLFCFVPDTSVNKQKALLKAHEVKDPVMEWGKFLLVRPWNESAFMASLKAAEQTPLTELNGDGNRAIILCSTTDPYQVILHPDPAKTKLFNDHAKSTLHKCLIAIRDHSTLNVRILTRSPLARRDFQLFKSFGDRLLLGVSLPTLNDRLSKIFEPKAPGPKQRFQLLEDAHAAGINTYVAVAPVYPEVGYKGLLEVFKNVKKVNPHTVFMEPINIRLGVAARIEADAKARGKKINTNPYTNNETWAAYALETLRNAERAAEEAGIMDRLHLWPDHEALGKKSVVESQEDPAAYVQWLESYWNRVSEWPGK
jgi:DNA repair photolyase